ncbi:MAG: Gfo/Idh/MocA family protein [Gemmatimonadota bacterium]
MSRPLGVAFLGCGAATAMHTRTLKRLRLDLRFHYASRTGGRAEEYRRRFGGAGGFASYEAAMESDEVDVVVVATPPARHLEETLAALSAGKHVIVEKPAFLRPEDTDTVREAASRVRRRVCVAENYYYKPLRRKVAELLAAGAVGAPLAFQVNAVKRQEARGWRSDAASAGGGALFEGGIHWINFMANLGLSVRGVHAAFPGNPHGPAEERTSLVRLDYEGGAVGTLLYSWEVPSPLKGLQLSRIHGREGKIIFESNGIFLLSRGIPTRFALPGLRDLAGYKAMFRDFFAAIREDREPEMTLELARQDLEIVRRAYASFDA